MKCLLLVVMACYTASVVDAHALPTVAGVTFGQSYFECKQILDEKFYGGEISNQISPLKSLMYIGVTLAGENFDVAYFTFQSIGDETFLSSIMFIAEFDLYDKESAENLRDRLREIFSQEQEVMRESTNSSGEKIYIYGTNPLDPSLGLCGITINKHDKEYWTVLSFGPLDFEKTEWIYSSKIDEMTDTKNSWATLVSKNTVGQGYPYKDTHATITVRYMKKYGEDVIISLEDGQIYGNKYNRNNYVMVRFDDGKTIKYWFVEPKDGSNNTIFLLKSGDFIKRCKNATSIKVEIPLFQSGRHLFRFTSDEPLVWKK